MVKVAIAHCPPWSTLSPPLHLGYLIAYLREHGHSVSPFDFSIELYDEGRDDDKYQWSRDLSSFWLEDRLGLARKKVKKWANRMLDSGAEVVGISITNDSKRFSFELIDAIKEQDKKKLVVAGGHECHPGYRTDALLNHRGIDIFVTGEGETTFLDIVQQYAKNGRVDNCRGAIIRKGGKLIDCGPRPPVNDLDTFPFPDFKGLPLKKYARQDETPILFSRGCIGKCVFCQDLINLRPYMFRSAENIFQEMDLRHRQGYVDFFVNDLTANGNIRQLDALSRLIMKSGFKDELFISGQMRCREGMSQQVFDNLKSAGWGTVLFGVESGSQKVLDLMNKGYKVNVIEKNIRRAHKAGIEALAAILVGFPGETEDTFQETLDFLKRNHRYLDAISSLYGLDLRVGSHIQREPTDYSIAELEDSDMYWETKDGKNTPGWRLELLRRVIEQADTLRIPLQFDESHFYFYQALTYYHNYKEDYKKSFEVMMDALQYLSTKYGRDKK